MIEDTKFVNFCCCFSRGDMTLGAMSNKNAYTAGEAASVTYEVNNNSTSDVNDIVVSLKSKILFSARNHRFACINCHGPPVKLGKVLAKTGFGSVDTARQGAHRTSYCPCSWCRSVAGARVGCSHGRLARRIGPVRRGG